MTAQLLTLCLVAMWVGHRAVVYPWMVPVQVWTLRGHLVLVILLTADLATSAVGP